MRPRGIPRGKRDDAEHFAVGRGAASMRPRGIPRGKPPTIRQQRAGFRYASMRPRGIPRGKRRGAGVNESAALRGFNEAAGNTPRKTSRAW